MSLLTRINDPKDLRELSVDDLKTYSSEVRQFMIDVMAKIGGHVAANLGVVELTTALHYVFDTPKDKIIWDVGHQCYAHKIITGRRDRFHTIRQDGGLSGFTKIEESPYDVFGAGHSSTSVSAGLGVAEGLWQQGLSNQVVSIIGDGALTAGMAYEALNHAGHIRRPNFIVVFNDNEMSISENVGALARFFSKRVTSSLYNSLRTELKAALQAVSTKDHDWLQSAHTLGVAVKDLFSTSSFFEALGFRYVGPIDGHNLDDLVSTFESVKKLSQESIHQSRENKTGEPFSGDAPILVHVKTKKGFGLKSAEDRPGDFHGVTGFCTHSGEPSKKAGGAPSYTGVFASTVTRIAESDRAVVAVTAAMPDGTGLSKFQKQFPNRFYDVGIAEQHAVTFASAMRLSGMRPAVAIYSTFMQRAFDQLVHDAAIQEIPLALFLDRGGLVGADGPTHHGVFDMSFMRCVPGMHIMAPKDENELQHMVYTALYCDKLASVRFPRGEGYGVALDGTLRMLPLGVSERIVECGKPVVVFWAAGSCVYPALEAAKELAALGVACDVVNARFIKPLDVNALMRDTGRAKLIVTIEENAVIGGLGAAVLEALAAKGKSFPVLNLGIPDEFIEHGAQGRLRAYCNIDQKGIVKKTLERLESISGFKRSPVESAILKELSEAPRVTH